MNPPWRRQPPHPRPWALLSELEDMQHRLGNAEDAVWKLEEDCARMRRALATAEKALLAASDVPACKHAAEVVAAALEGRDLPDGHVRLQGEPRP